MEEKIRKIMPCLDLKDGKVVKGVHFVDLKEMGDPLALARKYEAAGADELAMLDISKTVEGHQFHLDLIRDMTAQIRIPLTVGGGIASLNDIERILQAGAAKVSIASAALENPSLIRSAAENFGSDKIIVAFDIAADQNGEYYIYTHGGTRKTDQEVFQAIRKFDQLGAGTFLITGIGFDGAKNGFDIPFFQKAEQVTRKTLIASGGAGSMEDFVRLFAETTVEYGLAASVFHQNIIDIAKLKKLLSENAISVRL